MVEEILNLPLHILRYSISFHRSPYIASKLTQYKLHIKIFRDICVSKILFKIQSPDFEVFLVWYAIQAWNIIKIKSMLVDRTTPRILFYLTISIVFILLFGIQTQINEHVTNFIKFTSQSHIVNLKFTSQFTNFIKFVHPMIIINGVVAFVVVVCCIWILKSSNTN